MAIAGPPVAVTVTSPEFSKLDFPVHQGGPVGLDTLQFIHTAGDSIPGGMTLPSGLCMGGEMEALGAHLAQAEDPERNVRLFLGYAGWGAGQLEEELSTGSWVPAPADTQLLFSNAPAEEIWRSSLRSLGAAGENLSQLPPDVSWN